MMLSHKVCNAPIILGINLVSYTIHFLNGDNDFITYIYFLNSNFGNLDLSPGNNFLVKMR
jgi:hypothetical protein